MPTRSTCTYRLGVKPSVIGTVTLWVGPVMVNRDDDTMPERRTLSTPSAG